MTRLSNAWRVLTPDQRLAGAASAALFVTMFLPWYQQNAVVNAPRAAPLQSRNLNAFQVFSFVEAAVLLVAVAVLYLLWARGERRSFQLPGGDGTVVFAAGIWVALLLILRLFDKPGITTHGVAANVGIQWGIFFALAAAGLLAVAGSRMRAGARPEPPLLRRPRHAQSPHQPQPSSPYEPEPPLSPRVRRSDSRDRAAIVLEPEEPFARAARRPPAPRTAPTQRASRRPVAPEDATEQLSFEDHAPDSQPAPDLRSDPAPEPEQR
jgi:hypothetical protein